MLPLTGTLRPYPKSLSMLTAVSSKGNVTELSPSISLSLEENQRSEKSRRSHVVPYLPYLLYPFIIQRQVHIKVRYLTDPVGLPPR